MSSDAILHLRMQVDSLNIMANADDAAADWAKPLYDALMERFVSGTPRFTAMDYNRLRILKFYAQEKRQDAKRQRAEAESLQWAIDQIARPT